MSFSPQIMGMYSTPDAACATFTSSAMIPGLQLYLEPNKRTTRGRTSLDRLIYRCFCSRFSSCNLKPSLHVLQPNVPTASGRQDGDLPLPTLLRRKKKHHAKKYAVVSACVRAARTHSTGPPWTHPARCFVHRQIEEAKQGTSNKIPKTLHPLSAAGNAVDTVSHGFVLTSKPCRGPERLDRSHP